MTKLGDSRVKVKAQRTLHHSVVFREHPLVCHVDPPLSLTPGPTPHLWTTASTHLPAFPGASSAQLPALLEDRAGGEV